MSLDDLAYREGTDKGTRNRIGLVPKSYTLVYERLLGPIRSEPLTLVEIGVQKGASLRMWSDWMPNARIVGIDINPAAAIMDTGRGLVRIGDQADKTFLSQVISEFGPFDIVVDDGAHTLGATSRAFEALWPHTTRYYFIEDLQAQPPTREWLTSSLLPISIEGWLAVIRR